MRPVPFPRPARSVAALALLAAALLPATPARAQKANGAPAAPVRPPLAAGMDTNEVGAYLATGAQLLQKSPNKAAAYFRWAAELDPRLPDAPYGERIAILLSDRDRLLFYMRGDRKVRDVPELVRADSLQTLALMRAPLFFRRYDRALLTAYFDAMVRRVARTSGMSGEDESELQYEINKYLNSSQAPPYLRAWLAYSDGDFRRAAKLYDEALKRARKWERGDLLAERARAFAYTNDTDSAIVLFRASMAADSARDEDRLVFALESRAQMEHVLGALLLSKGDTAGAREAYGRALTEDLAYYPAHAALGELAWALGDTATARHEFREAVQVAGDDASLRYSYGFVRALSGEVPEGVNELLKAGQLAPHWAEPHLLLARLHEAASMPEEAVPHWKNFLARAALSHPARELAAQKVASAKPE